MTNSAIRVLHLDLFEQLRVATRATPGPLTFHVGIDTFAIQPHTPATRARARRNNAALALIPATHDERISHFVEVPEDVFPARSLAHLQVTMPSEDPAIYLPELVWVGFHLPRPQRLRHLQSRLETRGAPAVPLPLMAYGVDALPHGDAESIWRDLADFQTPLEAAKALVFHHPELASNEAYAATIAMEDHIQSPANSQALNYLALEISYQGQASATGGWAKITASTDGAGTPLTFGFDLGDRRAGEPVLTYQLSPRTTAALRAPIVGALRGSTDDRRLQNRGWSVQPGIAAFHQPGAGSARVRTQRGGLTWTQEKVTPDNGLTTDASSIRFDESTRNFSLEVKNHFLRSLGAYAQFVDVEGKVIRYPSGWSSGLPDNDLRAYESDSKKFLQIIAPTNAILGIPLPGSATTVQFRFPNEAASVRLLFGGLGTSRWDADVNFPGVILTAIFNFGVPTLCMIAGAILEDTKWMYDLLLDLAIQFSAMLAGKAVMGASAGPFLLQPEEMLLLFANAIGGLLVTKGLELLARKLLTRIAAAQIASAVPFVGWAVRAASLVVNGVQLGITTGQILSSPATLQINVKRTMNVRVVLTPDPRHGQAGRPETAVWPAVSDRYQITVQYLGGTYFVKRGAMPAATSSTPVDVTFEGLPAGGELQVLAGIYSERDWLCGRWQSEVVQALPPNNGSTLRVGGAIEEVLVPLTGDTQYHYKERIVYDAQRGGHVWRSGGLPTATLANLNSSNIGANLAALINLTINLPAYQIGYAWRASGQNLPLLGAGTTPETGQMYTFQNLSVLEDPGSQLKFVNRGMLEQPTLAYDTFSHLPGGGGAAISQRNFYIDARNGQYHLRRIVLGDGNRTIDLTATNQGSWGRFPLPHLDALAVHPSGYVVGASWAKNKLLLLRLPDAALPDHQAPVAQVLSGQGRRMGLLDGPGALSLTPDGRILILETINRRIQAFDTAGNPVPCFDGALLATFPAALRADLDAGRFSDAVQAQFQAHNLSHRCNLATSWQTTLDRAELTEALRAALGLEGVQLTHSPEQPSNPSVNARVEVKTAGAAWRIVDAAQSRAYAIAHRGSALAVFDELRDVTIDVRDAGKRWVLTDHASGRAYHLQAGANQADPIRVVAYQSFMALYQPDGSATYLDVAVESRGYIYVLSYLRGGTTPQDYLLDIYEPNGAFLSRTPDPKLASYRGEHICAARIVVDLWRNLYALNYEKSSGPGGRTEPTVSHWIPGAPSTTTRMPR